MSDQESSKDTSFSECPVCYERLHSMSTAERRLSCGHTFCHDCLVKYLVIAKQEGPIKKNIVCPLCRYVTFLRNKGICWHPTPGEKTQTLEVPMSPPILRHSVGLGPTNTLVVPSSDIISIENDTQRGIPRYLAFCPAESHSESSSNAAGSQIFIISDQGQPMESEESERSEPTLPRSGLNCCRSPSLILLLLMILVVAILAAVLPWILIAKKST
ncbi:RING finger protein 222 [Ambystoma mexicanum]|uniref:RING finger protein 222 n=1 Tax=Ambystoma mexicanum TaxID=8296 RepID=UPI0037E72D39